MMAGFACCPPAAPAIFLKAKVALEPQVYVMKVANADTAQVAYNQQLAVALPTATPGLDTDHIAVLRDGNHLDYYYGARWGGTAPQVTQAFIVSVTAIAAGFPQCGFCRRHHVSMLIICWKFLYRIFQAEYADSTSPTVRVTLIANLINIKERQSSPHCYAPLPLLLQSDNHLGAVTSPHFNQRCNKQR